MAGKRGNQNAKGNRGGGRKSAYAEKQDAEWLAQMWGNPQDVEALEDKLKSKKYSMRDIATFKGLKGSDRIIAKFMDKLVPDIQTGDQAKLQEPLPPLELKQTKDVVSLLEQTINGLREGTVDMKRASDIGSLSGHLIKAIELSDLERRLEEIERKLEKK